MNSNHRIEINPTDKVVARVATPAIVHQGQSVLISPRLPPDLIGVINHHEWVNLIQYLNLRIVCAAPASSLVLYMPKINQSVYLVMLPLVVIILGIAAWMLGEPDVSFIYMMVFYVLVPTVLIVIVLRFVTAFDHFSDSLTNKYIKNRNIRHMRDLTATIASDDASSLLSWRNHHLRLLAQIDGYYQATTHATTASEITSEPWRVASLDLRRILQPIMPLVERRKNILMSLNFGPKVKPSIQSPDMSLRYRPLSTIFSSELPPGEPGTRQATPDRGNVAGSVGPYFADLDTAVATLHDAVAQPDFPAVLHAPTKLVLETIAPSLTLSPRDEAAVQDVLPPDIALWVIRALEEALWDISDTLTHAGIYVTVAYGTPVPNQMPKQVVVEGKRPMSPRLVANVHQRHKKKKNSTESAGVAIWLEVRVVERTVEPSKLPTETPKPVDVLSHENPTSSVNEEPVSVQPRHSTDDPETISATISRHPQPPSPRRRDSIVLTPNTVAGITSIVVPEEENKVINVTPVYARQLLAEGEVIERQQVIKPASGGGVSQTPFDRALGLTSAQTRMIRGHGHLVRSRCRNEAILSHIRHRVYASQAAVKAPVALEPAIAGHHHAKHTSASDGDVKAEDDRPLLTALRAAANYSNPSVDRMNNTVRNVLEAADRLPEVARQRRARKESARLRGALLANQMPERLCQSDLDQAVNYLDQTLTELAPPRTQRIACERLPLPVAAKASTQHMPAPTESALLGKAARDLRSMQTTIHTISSTAVSCGLVETGDEAAGGDVSLRGIDGNAEGITRAHMPVALVGTQAVLQTISEFQKAKSSETQSMFPSVASAAAAAAATAAVVGMSTVSTDKNYDRLLDAAEATVHFTAEHGRPAVPCLPELVQVTLPTENTIIPELDTVTAGMALAQARIRAATGLQTGLVLRRRAIPPQTRRLRRPDPLPLPPQTNDEIRMTSWKPTIEPAVIQLRARSILEEVSRSVDVRGEETSAAQIARRIVESETQRTHSQI